MIQLEAYKGMKSRYTCPQCGKRHEFTRFINTDTGEYLQDNVGICNRSSNCGYRYTAKQYFADNPRREKFVKTSVRNCGQSINQNVNNCLQNQTTAFDFIAPEHLKATLGNYDRNAFVQFLLNLFPDCSEEIQAVLKMYFVGTSADDKTIFWQIDQNGKIRAGKIMLYDAQNGHRQIVRTWTDKDGEKHELKVDWIHSGLKRRGLLKEDFNLKQIFFGEHLLSKYPNKPVAIVEAEKTAIIATLCMSQFVWLATGSKQWLKAERLQRFDNRQVILYPDADGFDQWQAVALDAQRQGLNVKTSRLIENFATDQQKRNQYDLADYLINQQTEINELNEFIDRYNFAVDKTQACATLPRELKTILEETISIIEINGNLSRIEAERVATAPESMRRIIPSL